MFKKLISLTVAVVMVMALIAVPAMAAEEAVFSSANIKRNYYNLSPHGADNNIGYDSYEEANVPAVPHVNASAGTRDSHFRMMWKKEVNTGTYETVAYERAGSTAGYVSGTEAPRYVHQRVKFVWYDGTKKSNNQLYFGLTTDVGNELPTAEIFKIYGTDHDDVYFFDWGSAETNRRMMWNAGMTLRPIEISGQGEKIVNTMDLIINLDDNEPNHRGMVYVFFNGELCVYGKSAKTAPNAFYGWTLTQFGGDVGDYLEIWQDESLLGHTEYYTANGYVPTFEDVLNHAGLTDAVPEDSNIMMKTSDMRWFMPHGNDKVRIDSAIKDTTSNNHNWINSDGTMNTVVYNGTAATVSRTPSDSSAWEKAANLLAGVYPQTQHGIGYSSYHPRYKYVRFSFDQTMGEGTQLAYRLNDEEAGTALKLSDNNGKLKVDLCSVTTTSDASTTGTNKIDWVIEPDEGADYNSADDDALKHYLFVNDKLVAEATQAYKVRIDDIGLYTKGSNPSVVYDNWSMTLYNTNQTYDDLYVEITGEELVKEPTFKWTENCEIDDMDNTFMVYAEAVAKNYDKEAKIVFAVYDANGNFLDVDYCDFVSGEIYGDDAEIKAFNKVYGDKTAASASIFLWEAATLVPLIGAKTLPVE